MRAYGVASEARPDTFQMGVAPASPARCGRVSGSSGRVQAWVNEGNHPFLRVAISNDRLVNVDAGQVRFRWKDYAHGNRLKTMTLAADEFLRRFLLHVLPGGLVRIRHFGFLANRGRTGKLARCRALLAARPSATPAPPEPVAALMRRLTGVDITQCPVCHAGRLRIVTVFRPGQSPAPTPDTS